MTPPPSVLPAHPLTLLDTSTHGPFPHPPTPPPGLSLTNPPPLPQDTYFRNYTSLVDYYKGTFVQFGWPGIHDSQTQGVRAVAWVPKVLNTLIYRI